MFIPARVPKRLRDVCSARRAQHMYIYGHIHTHKHTHTHTYIYTHNIYNICSYQLASRSV